MRNFSDLSPAEVLSLAISTEDSNARCYQEWADRFRPYNAEISKLLETLAEEEKEHEQLLIKLYNEQFGEKYKPAKPENINEPVENLDLLKNHFFVVDSPMAKTILQAALDVELNARRFYEAVLHKTTDPLLLKTYKTLAFFEDEHVRVLETRLKELRS